MSNKRDIFIRIDVTDDGAVSIKYDAPVLILKKGEYWFASSPAFRSLGYSTVSEKDAVSQQYKDIETFFRVHAKLGTLDRALKNLGWTKASKSRSFERSLVDIPAELLRNSKRQQRAISL